MTADTVVLLPGLAGSADMWTPLARVAAGRYELRTPTLPWSSSADPSWAWDPAVGTTAIAGAYGPDDVVVAHSFAATLLLEQLARPGAHQPSAVVLLSSFYRPSWQDFSWETITHYLVDFHLILAEGVRTASRRPIAEDLLADMAVTVRNLIGPYGWMRFFETYLRTPGIDLTAVTVPVVVVHGQDDRAAPLLDSRELAAGMPAAAPLVPVAGSGHFPMVDRPDVVLRAVDDAIALRAARSGAPTVPAQPLEALA